MTAYRSRSRNGNGKQPLVFSVKEGLKDRKVQIKCGQCIECKMEHARVWAIRCVCEAQMYEERGIQSCFVTLTYNEDNIPYVKSSSMDGVYHQTLHKRDLQLFFKRLRKKGIKFRYFAAGEYGGKFERPHYHALLFGYVPPGLQLVDISDSGYNIYNSDQLDDIWSHGLTYVQQMSFETAFYCAGYALKKLTGRGEYFEKKYGVHDAEEYYDGKQKEFVTMSRRPGIGLTYYEKYRSDMYPEDKMNVNGIKVLPPRYFYDKEMEKETFENLQKGKWNKVTSRLMPTDIYKLKQSRVRKLQNLPEDIKEKRLNQARSRAKTQSIKEKRYEQRKKQFGNGQCISDKSILSVRPEIRIVQPKLSNGKSAGKSNKRIPKRGNESK